jgi:cytochrome c biogenesis protein ResB
VTVDGKSYEVALRWKRIYKPYTVHLLEFKNEKYLGTNIPKNYASRIRLVNPEQEEDREALIYMNHPLRYNAESHWLLFRGETFYQADFLRDGRRGTILQVVSNPGWLMPYLSCGLVSLGMLLHFGQNLLGFLARRFAR